VRFRLGPVSEDPEFDPEGDGWVRLRGPRPGHLLLVAVPLGLLMAGVVLFFLSPILRFEAPEASLSLSASLPDLLAAAAAALVGFIILHEILHASPTMVAGSSNGAVAGFWPRHLAPCVAFAGALSREAQLFSGALPFVLLTPLRFVVALVIPAATSWMAALSALNALGSAADLLMLGLLGRQAPGGAVVRNQGLATGWRSAE
jgi:hypothetical protein